jgi:hypothetical protein
MVGHSTITVTAWHVLTITFSLSSEICHCAGVHNDCYKDDNCVK